VDPEHVGVTRRAVTAMDLVAVARGHTGSPYDWLLAIGGLAYIAAVAFLRWRG
jgi:hypothetical protein